MNQVISNYISKLDQQWQAEIVTRLDETVTTAIPDADSRLQYGKPHYLRGKQYAAVVGPAKGWVSFTIFNAQALETPDELFEASDDGSRKTIKIKQGQTVDYDLLGKLVKQANE
jgi:hypothetical protein